MMEVCRYPSTLQLSESLIRAHPRFERLMERRRRGTEEEGSDDGAARELASALRGMSVGRMEPLWQALEVPGLLPSTTLVVGELDAKYVGESTRIFQRLVGGGGEAEAVTRRRVVVPGCGHAVHLERPLLLLQVLLTTIAL